MRRIARCFTSASPPCWSRRNAPPDANSRNCRRRARSPSACHRAKHPRTVRNPYKATLFEKNPDANWSIVWHQDTALPLENAFEHPEWGPWSRKDGLAYSHAPAWALARVIALRLHLDAATDANGPLRVITGSHRDGALSDAAVFELARRRPATTCRVGRGGVLAMRPLVVHASAKATDNAPRRVLHFEYAACLDLAPGIRLALA